MRRRGMLASKDAKLKLHADRTSASFATNDVLPTPSSFYTCTHLLYHSNRLIRDNFHALATRIQNWTASDAARFLRVATQRRRRRPRSRPEFMTAVMDLPPAFLYRTISFREPTNSYEVRVCMYKKFLLLFQNIPHSLHLQTW